MNGTLKNEADVFLLQPESCFHSFGHSGHLEVMTTFY